MFYHFSDELARALSMKQQGMGSRFCSQGMIDLQRGIARFQLDFIIKVRFWHIVKVFITCAAFLAFGQCLGLQPYWRE